jgi:23S rRNA pseudouridine2605 synthase
MERLQKVIAASGYTSRRKAEELIINGKVKVNGKTIVELGTQVDSKDIIEVEGKVLNKENKEYILLYKPRGVVTTTDDDKGRTTVMDLINTTKRLYPVGRLDYDTTGVLLLTNDGELTNLLIHPSSNIEKVYVAKIEGILSKEDIIKLSKGVIIDGRKTSKALVKVEKVDKKNNVSYVKLIIHEGRNHQVKKMFESLGYSVIKLKRENFAFLNLNGLKSGEYRYLSTHEVKMLYSLAKKKKA